MRIAAPALVPALLVSSLLLSCTATHERADASPRAFVDAWHAASCERALRCEFAERSEPPSACHPTARASLDARIDAVARGDARFDGARAVECVEGLERAACGDTQVLAAVRRACDGVLEGALRAGDRCDPTDAESDLCAPGLGCAAGSDCARCAPGGGPREPCVGPSLSCEEGLRCLIVPVDPESGGLLCGRLREPGERCSDTDFCESGVEGHRHSCQDGVCTPVTRLPLGAECVWVRDQCEEGAHCGASNVCEPVGWLGDRCDASHPCLLSLRCEEGECTSEDPTRACYLDSQCPPSAPWCISARCSSDPAGARCDAGAPPGESCPGDLTCSMGIHCIRTVADGEPCSTRFGARCGEHARCLDERCVAIARPGAACASSAVCPTGFSCDAGECAPLPSLGDACEDVCLLGECRDGRCVRSPEGAACDAPDDCEGSCIVSTCQPPASEGEPCGAAGRCAAPLECLVDADGSASCAVPAC
ncbi:hypothetical protein [Sandaracinus amylolyticus]|uniref:hypothetical protein n=1 Tax=Sandaracinus amylolyticus TaxID=927083 RepID=UPI001F4259BE|nr:hypothetical protein [Sandaracinus amylolyticus]UJR82293.1 Hypothetical protein I5071_43580 [Sandaracinus amylolyticus]